MKRKIKYKNRTFFRNTDGYYRDGKTTLHKFKYESKHGGILPFMQLHHKDANKLNNSINNLVLLSPKEHAAIHKIMRREYIFRNQLSFELI